MIDEYMLAHDLKKPGGPRSRKGKRTLSNHGQGSPDTANPTPATLRAMKEALAGNFEWLDAGVRRNVARHLLEWLDDTHYGGEYRRSGGQRGTQREARAQTKATKAAA